MAIRTAPIKRKLIEVSLPLESINRESAREKSIRHGHPSTMHLWWSRKPLATVRAVLFAQLVDDPSAHPEEFPTEEAQRAERERLHDIIRRLVVWGNTRDVGLLNEARAEILKSTDGNPPVIVDPFVGGGTIPLEAQRLGLEAHGSDLNPVAVLITKALIEIPPRFRDMPPVAPGKDSTRAVWGGPDGLASDVRYYGAAVRQEAMRRTRLLYPDARVGDGTTAPTIAWLWARTVRCPNPACRIEMPLVSKWLLGKKAGKEAYVVPQVADDPADPSGKRVTYKIGHDAAAAPVGTADGTVTRNGARCVSCDADVPLEHIRSEGRAGRMGAALVAIAVEGHRRRTYLAPTKEQLSAASVARPVDAPSGSLPEQALGFRVQAYGLTEYVDLFTNRQLVTLTAFSDVTREIRQQVLLDARAAGHADGDRLEDGGTGAAAYADAVVTYLAMALSRTLNKSSSLCSWDSSPKMEAVRGLFARQAISMAWDFAEANLFGSSSGSYSEDIDWVTRALEHTPAGPRDGEARQADAGAIDYAASALSTDPPYYDTIGYSDLSDFFYVWLRRSLHDVYPKLLSTLLVPKAEELVANPFRHGGRSGAQEFFEDGFRQVFARARLAASDRFPITVYYAFKQTDTTTEGTASTGWETLLAGMVHNRWEITATWPMRSELGNRMRSLGSNALASSIVLALRPRPDDAPSIDRRGLVSALQAELPDALRSLQQGGIAPVDLPQAAIGPGMAVFSRFSAVIEPDGSSMTVRTALARINEILDEVLNEQEGDFDPPTRFCIATYRLRGYAAGSFGDADNLSRARGTSVDKLERTGVLTSRGGKVRLIPPAELPTDYIPATDARTSEWEVLHHLIRVLEADGVSGAGAFLKAVLHRSSSPIDADLVKELAFLLFSIAEKNGFTQDAIAFNTIGQSWPDVIESTRQNVGVPAASVQSALDFSEE